MAMTPGKPTHHNIICPTCGHNTTFYHTGTQTYPSHVASQAGLPERIELYTCNHCHTTLSHVSLPHRPHKAG